MALDKLNHAKEWMNISTEMLDLVHRIEALEKVWASNLYGSGGANEIEQADMGTLPITPTILQGVEYASVHMLKFLDNDSPAAADHRASYAKGRNVDGTYAITLP